MLGGGKIGLAHRWSYWFFIGEIPKGLTVDHLCSNPPCVNPDHLDAVTQRENNFRSPKYLGNRTHCPRGHEYNFENTYIRPNLKGLSNWRDCKECVKRRGNEYRARLKAKNDPI